MSSPLASGRPRKVSWRRHRAGLAQYRGAVGAQYLARLVVGGSVVKRRPDLGRFSELNSCDAQEHFYESCRRRFRATADLMRVLDLPIGCPGGKRGASMSVELQAFLSTPCGELLRVDHGANDDMSPAIQLALTALSAPAPR
jgi:hypothetical protein